MSIVKLPIALVCTFVWLGFICAISFMEAWLKFRAPGVTLPLGLGIGRIVFSALNKVEWVMAIVIMLNMILSKECFLKFSHISLMLTMFLLIVQTIWLLPALDARAQLYMDGAHVLPSNLHFYYVGIEIVKVVCLFIFGISLFKSTLV